MFTSLRRSEKRNRGVCAAALLGAAAACTTAFAITTAVPASAAKYQFGSDTELRRLQSTPMTTKDGAPIDLGFRVTLHWFFLPYSVTADGYALIVQGRSGGVALDAAEIARLQKEGLLPVRMPDYALGITDQILGHLAWIVLVLLGMWHGGQALLGRLRDTATPVLAPGRPAARQHAQAVAQARVPVSQPAARPTVPMQHPAEVRRPPPQRPTAPEQATRSPAERPTAPSTQRAIPPAAAVVSLPVRTANQSENAALPANGGVARIKCRVKSLKIAA